MEKVCKVPKCGKKVKYNGYCSKHAEHIRLHGKIIKTRFDNRPAIIHGEIALIELGFNKNEYTIIDASDSWIDKYKWYKSPWGYVFGWVNGKDVSLQRMLMKPVKGLVVDHINRNILDNRRSNLRVCTRKQNRWNSAGSSKLGVKGVGFEKERNQYRARIRHNGKLWRSKRFDNIGDAVKAYDIKIKELRGDFAYANE